MFFLKSPCVLQSYFNKAKLCLALSDEMSAHESCKLSAITLLNSILRYHNSSNQDLHS